VKFNKLLVYLINMMMEW